MRPVTLADLEMAARALLAVAPDQRAALAADLLHKAHCADKYRRKTGRAHPQFGNGSLISAALFRPVVARPAACNGDYVAALSYIIRGLADRNSHHKD